MNISGGQPCTSDMTILARIDTFNFRCNMARRLAVGYINCCGGMAGCAGGHANVLVAGRRPSGEIMAVITLVDALDKRCNVACRLAHITLPTRNVASRTRSRTHTVVIPTSRKPSAGAMTAVTGFGQFFAGVVGGRFGDRESAVMAYLAFTRLRIRMVITGTVESGRVEVASFARCISHDVCAGFGCRHDGFPQRMATVTISGNPFEHAANVAGLACRRGMPSGERKPRGYVVEITSTEL